MNCLTTRHRAAICQAIAAMSPRWHQVELWPRQSHFPKILSCNTSFYLLGWTGLV
jgi:hypothetical protein